MDDLTEPSEFNCQPRAAQAVRTIPGLCCSGPDHWQTLWERQLPNCSRIDLPDWDDPKPDDWTAGIMRALAHLSVPVLLVAHSLGCHALIRSSTRHGLDSRWIVGALLVAPPDVEARDADARIARFAPFARSALPFPARLVASSNDPFATLAASRRMAFVWGAELVEAGPLGHINAASGLGTWPEGQRLAGLVR